MKIEITGSDYNELLSLISQFPNGKITAKNGVAFWDCTTPDSSAITQRQMPQLPFANNPQERTQSSNPFLRAFDSMASRF